MKITTWKLWPQKPHNRTRVPRVQFINIETYPRWLEQPLTGTSFHGPKRVRTTEVLHYWQLIYIFKDTFLRENPSCNQINTVILFWFFQCKALEDIGHNSLVVVASKDSIVQIGSEKGIWFLEKNYDCIRDFYNYCRGNHWNYILENRSMLTLLNSEWNGQNSMESWPF